MTVGIAESSDIDRITELYKAVSSTRLINSDDCETASQTGSEKKFENDFDTKLLIKAEEQSEIIGYASVIEKGGTCYIGRIIVRADYQKKGVGL